MPATLTVNDQTLGGKTTHSVTLEFPSERTTVRELIRSRVYQEVQDYNRLRPETFNGFQDEDGCPDAIPDRDHDGIPDDRDRCPDQPETYNGVTDEDGCPERGPSLVQIENGMIRILQQVNNVSGFLKRTGRFLWVKDSAFVRRAAETNLPNPIDLSLRR